VKPNGTTAENEVAEYEDEAEEGEDDDDDEDDDDEYVDEDEDDAASSLPINKKRSIDEVAEEEVLQGSKKIRA
jgi:hypothetical protein